MADEEGTLDSSSVTKNCILHILFHVISDTLKPKETSETNSQNNIVTAPPGTSPTLVVGRSGEAMELETISTLMDLMVRIFDIWHFGIWYFGLLSIWYLGMWSWR